MEGRWKDPDTEIRVHRQGRLTRIGKTHVGFSGGCQVQKREHVLGMDVGNEAQVPDGEGEDVEVGREGDLDRKAGLSTSVRRTD